MLVAIAAISIPNIGNVKDSARDAVDMRNAQTVASVLNAAETSISPPPRCFLG